MSHNYFCLWQWRYLLQLLLPQLFQLCTYPVLNRIVAADTKRLSAWPLTSCLWKLITPPITVLFTNFDVITEVFTVLISNRKNVCLILNVYLMSVFQIWTFQFLMGGSKNSTQNFHVYSFCVESRFEVVEVQIHRLNLSDKNNIGPPNLPSDPPKNDIDSMI